jgi:hypothetical protein
VSKKHDRAVSVSDMLPYVWCPEHEELTPVGAENAEEILRAHRDTCRATWKVHWLHTVDDE